MAMAIAANPRKIYKNPESKAFMIAFCVSVGLTVVLLARGNGDCAPHGLYETFEAPAEAVAYMRDALARLLETVFVHTALYKWLDDYKMQPASAGPGLLRRLARALRGGGMSNWFGSGALQAYARWRGRPVLVIWERVRKPGEGVIGTSWSECFGLHIFHPDRDEPEYVNGTDSEERARALLAARRDCKVLFRSGGDHFDFMSRSSYPGNSGASSESGGSTDSGSDSGASSDSGGRAGASEGDVSSSDCGGRAGASEGD